MKTLNYNAVIGEKEYKVKNTFRSIMEWEEAMEKSIMNMKPSFKELSIFLYCCLWANNKDFMSYDELLTYMDDDMSIFNTFTQKFIELNETDSEKK